MRQGKISNNLLFTQQHFDLLATLYRSSINDYHSARNVYEVITETAAKGLYIDRASFWRIAEDRLICQNLFDSVSGKHSIEKDLPACALPNYFKALKEGIAIVADDVLTNEYTKELKDLYLIPHGITDMLDLPIRENGVLIGVLCCEHRDDPRTWSASDLAFARALGDIMTLLVEQCKRRMAELEIEKLYAISKKLNEKLLDFTYIISHNIRSNTSNMSMIIDLIDDTEILEEKREYFQLLKESNNKLSDTIHYLNETISIQLGSKESKVKLNLKSEIEKTLLGVNGIIKKEHATIKIALPEGMEIRTIPSYFESIMFNLITNAIKYKSPERNPVIEITAKRTNSKTVILVSDNGVGIDLHKNKNKIFGMYKTFHGNNDAVGLGLFMTRNHVEALGGTIEVESEMGKGSTFKVVL
ncbi:MAG TPA: GAF domain-containing sensor histidine kinase [Flavobacterium sp.]|nr:GAF domain-containing sensor histidine kinase [Flavobacterium sp.]